MVHGAIVIVLSWGLGQDGVDWKEKRLAEVGEGIDLAEVDMVVSANGKHLAYSVSHPGSSYVVAEGKAGEKFDHVFHCHINNDGTVAYLATKGKEDFIVIGETKSEAYEAAYAPTFSGDGKSVAYPACIKDKWFVVRDGKRGEVFDEVLFPQFSPKGDLVYAARTTDKWFLFVGDKKLGGFDDVGYPTFSKDGMVLAYFVKQGEKVFVVHDDKKGEAFEEVLALDVSPDGKRVAYSARQGDKYYVVADGQKRETKGQPLHLAFGRSGKTLAWVEQRGESRVIVIDGAAKPEYPYVKLFGFGKDDTSVVYKAQREKVYHLVVGDTLSEPFDDISTVTISADGKKVGFGARKGRELWWKVMDVK